MFGFLKSKTKSKNYPAQDLNGRHYSKDKNKKPSKEKKEKHTCKANDARDASQPSNSFFKKAETLPAQAGSRSLSNGHSSNSCASLDQLSSSDLQLNSASETSEIHSKSSSCRYSYALSTSSSRSSIPSITTEFVDEDLAVTNSTSTPKIITTNQLCANETKEIQSTRYPSMYSAKQVSSLLSTALKPLKEEASEATKESIKNYPISAKPISPKTSCASNHNSTLVHTLSNDDEDTSVGSSIYSAPPSPSNVIPSSSQFNNFSPTNLDCKHSLESTPSTSSSSLSSLSVRPNSPSGRKTQPGPKMGTIAKLGASPTTSRKMFRTNIKTNPNASSSAVGTIAAAAPSTVTSIATSPDTEVSLPVGVSQEAVIRDSSFQIEQKFNNALGPSNSNADSFDSSLTKSYSITKPRHSVSSVQSLESIPESEHDLVAPESNIAGTFKDEEQRDAPSRQCSIPNLPELKEESSAEDEQQTFLESHVKNISQMNEENPEVPCGSTDISVKAAFDILRDTIMKEKQFANLIMRDYLENRNDEDSSESFREPEVKEHRLELIPDSLGLMNTITFTTDKVSPVAEDDPKEKNIADEGDKSTCEPQSQSDPESSTSLSLRNVTPTHAVFQIPLRSKSCSRERSESPCYIPSPLNASPVFTAISSHVEDDELQLRVSNMSGVQGGDDASEVACVEGHVELNFDRGRKSDKTSSSQRRRSLSTTKRQKLYDDIKKFTAETKELKIKDNGSESINFSPNNRTNPYEVDADGRKSAISTMRENLKSSEKTKISARPRSSSSQRRVVNTLPRTNLKKLERSITVAEIKVNVNGYSNVHGKQPTSLCDSAVPALGKISDVRSCHNSSSTQTKIFHKRSKSDTDDGKMGPKLTPNFGSCHNFRGNDEVGDGARDRKSFLLQGASPVTLQQISRADEGKHPDPLYCTENMKYNEKFNQKLYHSDGKLNVLRQDASECPCSYHLTKDASFERRELELTRKELAALQGRYDGQVESLTALLAQKEQELARAKSEAAAALQEAQKQNRKEQEEMKLKLEREKQELEEKHRREREEREEREREERYTRDKEIKELREKEERRIREEQERNERKRKEEEEEKKILIEDKEQSNDEQEEQETEEESSKRALEKLQVEMLLLRQQNEEFEEMVREKYRRQVELEVQIGEMNKEIASKEANIQSVKVELSYSKNETELTRGLVKRLTEELEELKQRVESLEQELEASERELKRMEILQEKLQVTEAKKNEMQAQINDIELERDEEIKIIQDALDEAAEEREELLTTFEKELERLTAQNAAREAQMLLEFEEKLKELERQHKKQIEDKEREAKAALQRNKRMADEEEVRQRLEKLRSDLNSEWEDKLRRECSRLKGELDELHAEEKHLAVESVKVQKDQELHATKKNLEVKAEALNKEISTLKESLVTKEELYQQELDDVRTQADRDVWELRRKLQRLDETTYDRRQQLEDKHREELERLREEYADKLSGLEAQLACVDVRGMEDLRTKLETCHKTEVEHLCQQHRLSMERLRDELEAEKAQAAEEARVLVTKHHEYIIEGLRDQLAEAVTTAAQYRDEIEAIKFALSRREEVIRSLEEDVARLRSSKCGTPSSPTPAHYTSQSPSNTQAPVAPFQFPHEGSQGSRSSQDRLSNDTDDDGHKGSGLLGKVFGGGWFSGGRARESSTAGYSSPTGGSSKKNRQST
ncbi:calponin homology domain-containing protein DDB_G0272472 isoform X2 [Hyalella azteca]|uniref:Calponin homology domain-containing protein DDB_G0272472 isoform X2 n=1 Tax=Hyalella azteca TaxID=294128 RepID=A0A8B7N1Z5_HYAAZ|nr:calponin homology domain-containing protein DDB_G0272472 isoform X2 [Hyalella azteca]